MCLPHGFYHHLTAQKILPVHDQNRWQTRRRPSLSRQASTRISLAFSFPHTALVCTSGNDCANHTPTKPNNENTKITAKLESKANNILKAPATNSNSPINVLLTET